MNAVAKFETGIILFASLLFGLLFWLVDGLFEYRFFHDNLSFLLLEGPETLWESLFTKISPHSLFTRAAFILASFMAGLLAALFVHLKRKADDTLAKANREKTDLQDRVNQFRKLEPMGLLVGSVAHDLNNILSGVVSYPEMMLKDPALSRRHRELVAATLESGQRAVDVVSDLLTIARGVAGNKTVLNLNDLIGEFLTSAEFGELQKTHPSVMVESDLDADLTGINGSALHIRKALMNLVVNAVEAVDGNGVIRIRTACQRLTGACEGYLGAEIPAGDYAVLSVSDTGSGISEADMGKIFEPFYTKKAMGRSGTGLGLAVVWNTVQDHDGHIGVVSSPAGTVFHLYFGAASVQEDRPRPQPPSAPPKMAEYQGNGEKILVVDDEGTQRDIACRILNLLGYHADAVGSGEEALAYLRDHSADLLVLDMFMKGGMNGAETYEEILKINPCQKAIIASGYAEDASVRRTLAAGAGAFLTKPYSMETIGLAIRKELTGG